MFKFQPGTGLIVAGDTKNTIAAFDDALLNGARMFASIIETTKQSNLPAGHSQKLLSSVSAGLQSVVQGRREIVSAIKQMTVIKGLSNFAPEDAGCPAGWEALSTKGVSFQDLTAHPDQLDQVGNR